MACENLDGNTMSHLDLNLQRTIVDQIGSCSWRFTDSADSNSVAEVKTTAGGWLALEKQNHERLGANRRVLISSPFWRQIPDIKKPAVESRFFSIRWRR
jgi:hypothetical protein